LVVDLKREKILFTFALGSSNLKFLLGLRLSRIKIFIGSLCAVDKISGNAKFEVLAVLNINVSDLCDVTSYSLMDR